MAEGISRPWYENALLLAAAGSVIAVIGQLAGTVIPIMYGPQDVSDFSIGVDPVEGTLLLFPDNNHPENNSYALDPPDWYVKVEDSHAHLRPYRFGVLLKSFEKPEGVSLAFHLPEIHPGDVSRMNFTLSSSAISLNDGGYPITIQGVGGDGRRRNTTFFLNVRQGNLKAYQLQHPTSMNRST
jgi:hypothetical protein